MRENAKVVTHGKFRTFLLIYYSNFVQYLVFMGTFIKINYNTAVKSTQSFVNNFNLKQSTFVIHTPCTAFNHSLTLYLTVIFNQKKKIVCL